MAAQLSGKATGGRGRRRYRQMSEINVTPFVDVMLVLLIVFMVAAPLLNVAVPVDLPQTKASPVQAKEDEKPLVISIDQAGKIYVQETEVQIENLVALLHSIKQQNPNPPLFVRGDQGVNYGRVMEVMGALNSAGFTKVSLVAQLPHAKGPGR